MATRQPVYPPGALLDTADPAVIMAIGCTNEMHIADPGQAVLLEGVGQLHERIGFDCHGGHLVRFTVYLISGLGDFCQNSLFFINVDLYKTTRLSYSAA